MITVCVIGRNGVIRLTTGEKSGNSIGNGGNQLSLSETGKIRGSEGIRLEKGISGDVIKNRENSGNPI